MNNGSTEWLRALVALDTTSSNSNLQMMEHMSKALVDLGFHCTLDYSPDGTKANLLASFGPSDVPGVLLSGHSDTVPVTGQAWSLPAFALTERDGKCYGRGTADMKGFLACVLAAMPAFVSSPLRMPIQLLFSHDEEIGCRGVRSALRIMETHAIRPRLCLIGEPTEMKPVLGHKGKLAMRCHVRGHACHSAYTQQGVNAIEYAARLIVQLHTLGQALRAPEHQDPRFDPPHATVQTGVISGGQAINIVPADCSFDFEVRSMPSQDSEHLLSSVLACARDQLEPEMQAVSPQASIRFSELSAYPGLVTAPSDEAAKLLGLWCGSTEYGTVAYGTEGGLISRLGIPVVVCGPGSMDQGHKPDEYVTQDQLQKCDQMLVQLRNWMCGQAA
jgi:acetylornithine deacetylase